MAGLAAILVVVFASGQAAAAVRTLDLYVTQTKERLQIVYKRNGAYVPSALRELNRFLRDWRRNESTQMDPELFDLIWEVQQEFGGRTVRIVSAYRSPATNSMLRRRSRGVAKNSQHMAGKAMDFYIPGVGISKIRREGMKRQVGGVGYYPRSRTPFVHLDTGRVRSWPRMSRSELAGLFPDGKTLHLPSSGKPLSGYQAAQEAEKAGKLASLQGGSPLGVRSLLAFAGGRRGGGPAANSGPGGIVRPGRGGAERVVASRTPETRSRPERRQAPKPQQARQPQPAEARKPQPAEARKPQPAEAVPVRTASLGPAPASGGGLFRELPSVSLGGLISRFRRNDEDDSEGRPVDPPTAVAAVAPAESDDDGEADAASAASLIMAAAPDPVPAIPPVPRRAPRESLRATRIADAAAAANAAELLAAGARAGVEAEQPGAADDAQPRVVLAALPPQRPQSAVVDSAPPLAYARPHAPVNVMASPPGASVAKIPRTARSEPVAPATLTRAPVQAVPDAPDAPGAAFAPMRGASPALIAHGGGLSGTGFARLSAPDRTGAARGGVLLAGEFLGTPTGFATDTNWPSTDRFTGVKITVYADPRR